MTNEAGRYSVTERDEKFRRWKMALNNANSWSCEQPAVEGRPTLTPTYPGFIKALSSQEAMAHYVPEKRASKQLDIYFTFATINQHVRIIN